MENQQINYRSDFPLLLSLSYANGNPVGYPLYDWAARFWTTTRANTYTVGVRGGVATNCREEQGKILAIFDHHGLSAGQLNMELTVHVPNDLYPDGSQDETNTFVLPVELITGTTPLPTQASVDLILPYIKGDAFTYADFTDEQLKGLTDGVLSQVRPDVDAAIKQVTDTDTAVNTAEAQRVTAENERIANEQERVSDEQKRVSD
jgi:hypothetical protein